MRFLFHLQKKYTQNADTNTSIRNALTTNNEQILDHQRKVSGYLKFLSNVKLDVSSAELFIP